MIAQWEAEDEWIWGKMERGKYFPPIAFGKRTPCLMVLLGGKLIKISEGKSAKHLKGRDVSTLSITVIIIKKENPACDVSGHFQRPCFMSMVSFLTFTSRYLYTFIEAVGQSLEILSSWVFNNE